MNTVGDASRHDLPGPFEEGFGLRCSLSINIEEICHMEILPIKNGMKITNRKM